MQNERKSLKQKKKKKRPSTEMVATLYQEYRTQNKEKQYSGGNLSPFFSANPNSPTLKPFYPTSSETDSVLTSLYFVVFVVHVFKVRYNLYTVKFTIFSV